MRAAGRTPSRAGEAGFSMIEILVSILIMVVGILGFAASAPTVYIVVADHIKQA